MICRRVIACLLPLSLYTLSVEAIEPTFPTLHLNGFGTLGVVHSSEDKADFRGRITQPDGAGFSRSLALGVDSRLGLQVEAELAAPLTAVVQIVSEQRHDGRYTPQVEWANIKYELTPGLDVRLGRTVLPTFMASDYRKVGYANPWIRPPLELYGLLPLFNQDGVDASYRFRIGRMSNSVQAYYGRNDFRLPDLGTFKGRGLLGVIGTTEFGNTVVRGGYQQGRVTAASITDFLDAFRSFGPRGHAIADRYDPAGKQFNLWTIGALYDPGDWFVRGEWVRTERRSLVPSNDAWYVTSGYRFGSLMPYAGVAQRRKRSVSFDPGLDTAMLNPPARDQAIALNSRLNAVLSSNASTTVTVGTRWDFRPDFSLKFQFDQVRLARGSRGGLVNMQPGFERGTRLNVYSAALEFVF